MANFLSDIANEPARAPRFGGLICRKAKIAVPTGLAVNDTFQMCQIPKGAVIVDGFLFHDDLGTTITLDAGYGGGTIDGVVEDPNAFIAAAAGGTAGRKTFDQAAGLIDLGPLDAERPLIITATAVTGATVGADIACVVQYMLSA